MKIDTEEKELEIGEAQAAKAADAAIVNEEQLPDEIGDVKVADEVISIVAGLAAQEVNGVIGMSSSFAEGLNEFLGKKSFDKGVRITVDGHVVTAAVYVNVEYGSCIPEIALEIQEKVKEAIENMTGYEVKFVDVHIQGVARQPKSELEESLEKMDAAHENFFSEE
ncbi:MAG: Asp23/Gls24 family envelope stress response protein [Acidaminococcaceae bacterium]|nr:Asp23/Gls24 family envelope stress response protein [Acidaminococcaceae bacterium]